MLQDCLYSKNEQARLELCKHFLPSHACSMPRPSKFTQVNKMSLGQVFLAVIRFPPISITPSMLHTHTALRNQNTHVVTNPQPHRTCSKYCQVVAHTTCQCFKRRPFWQQNARTKEHRVTHQLHVHAHNSTAVSPRRRQMTFILQVCYIVITIYIRKYASSWLERDLFEKKLSGLSEEHPVRLAAPSL